MAEEDACNPITEPVDNALARILRTKTELANAMNITRSLLSSYLDRRKRPKLATAEAIAKGLNVLYQEVGAPSDWSAGKLLGLRETSKTVGKVLDRYVAVKRLLSAR